jgi:hypothetical protein
LASPAEDVKLRKLRQLHNGTPLVAAYVSYLATISLLATAGRRW